MKDAPLPRWAAYAIYFVLLLWAGLEILRSLDRLDGVVFLGYVQTGEAVLQHKDPYGYALTLINTWPPFFFFVSGALALMARASLPGALLAWQWRAVAWTGVFLVGLNAVLPAVVFGPAHALADWQRWRAISARGLLDPTPTYFNQSLVAAMKRLFTVAGSARDPVHYAIAAWPT